MKRIGTTQRKTRHKLTLSIRERGKVSLSRYFQQFKVGDSVGLRLHPIIKKGRFYSRFHGFTGIVEGKKGECYEIVVADGHKTKHLRVHPIHLMKHA